MDNLTDFFPDQRWLANLGLYSELGTFIHRTFLHPEVLVGTYNMLERLEEMWWSNPELTACIESDLDREIF